MKKLLLILMLSCVGTMVAAQNGEVNNHRVGLGYGLAIPIGNFSDTDFRNSQAGFARAGTLHFNRYEVTLNKHFGIGATAGSRTNKVDKERMLAAYNQRRSGLQPSNAAVDSTPWVSAFLLTDLLVQHSLDKLVFMARGSFGLSYNVYSETWFGEQHQPGSNNMFYYNFQAAKAVVAPVFGLAGGLRYNIGDLGIGLEVGVLTAKPAFNLNSGSYDQPELKQQMISTNTTASLSYAFSVGGPGAPAGHDSEKAPVNHTVGIQAGAAIPIGDYRSIRFLEPQAGFAKSGTNTALTYQAAVHPSLGLGTTLGWRRNGFAMNEFAPSAGRMRESQATLDAYKSGTWETYSLTADLYFMLPFGPVTLYTKGSYGAAIAQSPDLALNLIKNADFEVIEMQWKSGKNLSAVTGYSGGIRYTLGRMGVGAEAGVMQLHTKSKLQPNQTDSGVIRPMHTVNTSFNVFYSL